MALQLPLPCCPDVPAYAVGAPLPRPRARRRPHTTRRRARVPTAPPSPTVPHG